jgi:hypothetical protein
MQFVDDTLRMLLISAYNTSIIFKSQLRVDSTNGQH